MATLAPEDFIVTFSFSNWHQLDAHSVTSKCIFYILFFLFSHSTNTKKNLSGCSSSQKIFLLFQQLFFSFFYSYVPSIVPKHNKLVLTAGSKKLDKTFFKRNVHLASSTLLAESVNLFCLPWFHVSLCSHPLKTRFQCQSQTLHPHCGRQGGVHSISDGGRLWYFHGNVS